MDKPRPVGQKNDKAAGTGFGPVLVLLVCILVVLSWGGPAGAEDLLDALEAGFMAQRQGRYEDAQEMYSKLIQAQVLEPRELTVVLMLRGETRMKRGDFEGAVEDLSQALNIRSSYIHALYLRGLALERLNRYQEALADLQRAVALRPDKETYQQDLSELKTRMALQGLLEKPKESGNDTAGPKPSP
ncbi:MAG: tetratricopeptide repeat protein [Proteobacteria bacterium]|nr:tetratricopeptide repeat protein [Pseudomonadota bacterium]